MLRYYGITINLICNFRKIYSPLPTIIFKRETNEKIYFLHQKAVAVIVTLAMNMGLERGFSK